MTWTTFHCEEPDFWVRSVQDDVCFDAERSSLERSDVFRDMFSFCENGPADNRGLDLEEPAETLALLLRLLHTPPSPPILLPRPEKTDPLTAACIRVREYVPGSVIPLPMLPVFFILADKYMLTDSIVCSLHSHLLANASVYPLQVYSYAVRHGLDSITNAASKYLLHPPLSSYTLDDIKILPSPEAYHRLLQLHAFRINRLREILLTEEIFPHGYRECPSHSRKTTALWERARCSLACKIEAGTDVAAEMSVLMDYLYSCRTCHKACTAAVEMLAYKCRRVPKQIDQLPSDT